MRCPQFTVFEPRKTLRFMYSSVLLLTMPMTALLLIVQTATTSVVVQIGSLRWALQL